MSNKQEEKEVAPALEAGIIGPCCAVVMQPGKPPVFLPYAVNLAGVFGSAKPEAFPLGDCVLYIKSASPDLLTGGNNPYNRIATGFSLSRLGLGPVWGPAVIVPVEVLGLRNAFLPHSVVSEIQQITAARSDRRKPKQEEVAVMSSTGATQTPPTERVNHPLHYGGDTLYEAIKVIEAWELGFLTGNAVKYISRAGKKDDTPESLDLRKAIWYLQRALTHAENRESAEAKVRIAESSAQSGKGPAG